jgi:hypothetical protein
MDHEQLLTHILAVADRPEDRMRGLTEWIVASCWPGGLDDHAEPAALGWLRRWRPEGSGTELPTCRCSTGHCTICN